MKILTYSDLQTLPLAKIKTLCRVNGVEVSGDRRRRDSWVEAYLSWQFDTSLRMASRVAQSQQKQERKVYNLNRDELIIVAQVANWAEYGNIDYDADDIVEVAGVAGLVIVSFVDGHFTTVDQQQFRDKVVEFKSQQPKPAPLEEWESVSKVLGGHCRYLGGDRWGIQGGTTNDAGLRGLLRVNLSDRELSIAKGLIPIA